MHWDWASFAIGVGAGLAVGVIGVIAVMIVFAQGMSDE